MHLNVSSKVPRALLGLDADCWSPVWPMLTLDCLLLLKGAMSWSTLPAAAIADKTLHIESRHVLRLLAENTELRQIKAIRLHGSQLTTADLHEILAQFPQLSRAHFDACEAMDDHVIDCFLRRHGRCIKALRFQKCFTLTNESLHAIATHCTGLVQLEVSSCMFTASGLGYIADGMAHATLQRLVLARCHLMAPHETVATLLKLGSLLHLEISGNDMYLAQDFRSLICSATAPLKVLDISDCVEVTRTDVNELVRLRPMLQVVHTAKLEDHSTEAIRSYLLTLVGSGP